MRAHSAYFSFRLGKGAAAYAVLSPSARHLQSSTDQFAGMYALWYLGFVSWELGRFAEANESLQTSLEKARACDDRWWETLVGEYIGIVAHATGDYDRARCFLTEALAGAREMGDPMLIAHVLGYLSQTMQALDRTAEAEKLLRESLALAQETGYRTGIGIALDRLGLLAQVSRPEEARTLFAASCEVIRETGDLRNLPVVLSHQGYNSIALSDVADAQNSFIEVLRLAREGDDLPFALDALAGLAMIWAEDQSPERALELVIHILQHPAAMHPAAMQDATSRAERLRGGTRIALDARANSSCEGPGAEAEYRSSDRPGPGAGSITQLRLHHRAEAIEACPITGPEIASPYRPDHRTALNRLTKCSRNRENRVDARQDQSRVVGSAARRG